MARQSPHPESPPSCSAGAGEAEALQVPVRQRLPLTIVAPAGALSAATVPRLRHMLVRCLTECPDAVIIHLRRMVTDSDLPLAVFRVIRKHASIWPAVPVLLCEPTPDLAERLVRTGLDRILPVHPTVAAAIAATRAPPALARADHDLLPGITAPARARTVIADVCRTWGLAGLVGAATLIISELVTNAVTHARGPVRVTAVLRQPHLHLIVRDGSVEPPQPQPLAPPGAGRALPTTGRGLHLLDAVAHSWGHLSNSTGKVVWARLRLPQPALS